MDEERAALRQTIRAALAHYARGRFETGGNGGADGMLFFIDSYGRKFFIGGLNREHAQRATDALNAVLRLLESRAG